MMDEPGSQRNWQSLGPTLDQEVQSVAHLDPRVQRVNDGSVYKQHLSRGYSTRCTRSTDVPTLHRNTSIRLTTRLKRFVNRLTWQKRSKSYLFGKQFLQRQPSFVMTPDRSSFTYRFRSRDLVKSRPHPRYDRSSQPVAAWKHANPMDVLLNKGQVAVPQLGDEENKAQEHDPRLPSNMETPDSPSRNISSHVNLEGEGGAHTVDTPDRTMPQTWQKVTLPVKQDRNSSSSQEYAHFKSEQSTPRNAADQSASGSGSKSDSQPRSKSQVSYGSCSALDLPPTPLETRKSPAKAKHLPSRSLSIAMASEPDAPRSPTSARSLYRPESWRRSAVVTRGEQLPSPDPFDLDLAIEFVGAWGTYLKRAIAVKVAAERKRYTWEQQIERRWSSNLPYDSDYMSPFDTSSTSRQTRSECYTRSEDYDPNSYGDTKNVSSSDHTSPGSTSPSSLSARNPLEASVMDDSTVWHTDISDFHDEDPLPDAASESSSIISQNEEETIVKPKPRLSSPYIEAISLPNLSHPGSPNRPQTSINSQSPMKSTSSLAPPNSPRALAAIARTSASRKRFSDSLDAAEKRYSVLFQQEPVSSPKPVGSTFVQSEQSGLNALSQWQPEESDKETSVPTKVNTSDLASDDATNVSALRVKKAQAESSNNSNLKTQPDDFDFTDLSASRKRPLPASPVTTPHGSNIDLSVGENHENIVLPKRNSFNSFNSGAEDDAPSLLKNQSVRKHRLVSSHKRVKSSISRDNLLLMRQNTLHSQWAEEDSDTDTSEHCEANKP